MSWYAYCNRRNANPFLNSPATVAQPPLSGVLRALRKTRPSSFPPGELARHRLRTQPCRFRPARRRSPAGRPRSRPASSLTASSSPPSCPSRFAHPPSRMTTAFAVPSDPTSVTSSPTWKRPPRQGGDAPQSPRGRYLPRQTSPATQVSRESAVGQQYLSSLRDSRLPPAGASVQGPCPCPYKCNRMFLPIAEENHLQSAWSPGKMLPRYRPPYRPQKPWSVTRNKYSPPPPSS